MVNSPGTANYAPVHFWIGCLCLVAGLAMVHESRGDGGSVLARQSVGKETYILIGNQSGLRVGLVDLDLVVEGCDSRIDPVTITFRYKGARESELVVMAQPQSMGKAVLFPLHVDLTKAGPWMMFIPLSNGDKIEWTVELRNAGPVPWQMAGWYLWPIIVVIVFGIREVIVRSRSYKAHRLRSSS